MRRGSVGGTRAKVKDLTLVGPRLVPPLSQPFDRKMRLNMNRINLGGAFGGPRTPEIMLPL